jgi:hypothetical protein
MSLIDHLTGCGRKGRTFTKCALLFGLLNAVLMIIVPSMKSAQQAKVQAAAAAGECSLADLNTWIRCLRNAQSDNIRNPPKDHGDLCSDYRGIAGCIPECFCHTEEGKELMIDLQILVDRHGPPCTLICGDGSWLPQESAAALILFGLVTLPFNGAGALTAFGVDCERLACLERILPMWGKCLLTFLEATVLIVLQVKHKWSMTGWAFSVMCCINFMLYGLAMCDPKRADSTHVDSVTDSGISPAREMSVIGNDSSRPALEESKSTVATSSLSRRPPQIQEAIRNGII